MCNSCLAGLAPVEACCYLCRRSARLGRTCALCREASPLISVNSATAYNGVAKDMLWKLKFERLQAAADVMATLMAERFGEYVADDMLIMPVPTATSRVRMRGYDQAALLARSFAARSRGHYTPLLMRLGHQEQIGADRRQRHEQLEGVFQLRRQQSLAGARIILIDDVLTTGATMEEAARCLQAAGAKAVGALVFARP